MKTTSQILTVDNKLINYNTNYNIHLVLYSNNEPYNTTKKLIIDSVNKYTNKNIIIHDYNLEKIKLLDWFVHIKDMILINKKWKRDGYYNSWKPFIVRDVYNTIPDNDILYYVDCSKHFKTGFTQYIDNVCDIAFDKGFIAGGVSDNVNNNTNDCCDKLVVWNIIIPNNNNKNYLSKMHVLNSWFILKKKNNDTFINDWVYFSCYKFKNQSLITYHHTVDQSIFNILVYKHNLYVFHHKKINHRNNKNKNNILKIINKKYKKNKNINKYFINLV